MNEEKTKLIRDFIDKNADCFAFGSVNWELSVELIDDGTKLEFCSFSRFGTKTHFPVAFHRPISKSVDLSCLEIPKKNE